MSSYTFKDKARKLREEKERKEFEEEYQKKYESPDEFMYRIDSAKNAGIIYEPDKASERTYCSNEEESLQMLQDGADASEMLESCARLQKGRVASREDIDYFSRLHPEMADEDVQAYFDSFKIVEGGHDERLSADVAYGARATEDLNGAVRNNLSFGMNRGKNYDPKIRETYLKEQNTTNITQDLGVKTTNNLVYMHGIKARVDKKLDEIYRNLGVKDIVEDKELAKSLSPKQQKELAVKLTKYIAEHTNYDTNIMRQTQNEGYKVGSSELESMYFVLCRNRGICEDFSITLSKMLKDCGIENTVLKQNGADTFGHATVLVNIGGQNLIIDPTEEVGKRDKTFNFSGVKLYSPEAYAKRATRDFKIPEYKKHVFVFDQNDVENSQEARTFERALKFEAEHFETINEFSRNIYQDPAKRDENKISQLANDLSTKYNTKLSAMVSHNQIHSARFYYPSDSTTRVEAEQQRLAQEIDSPKAVQSYTLNLRSNYEADKKPSKSTQSTTIDEYTQRVRIATAQDSRDEFKRRHLTKTAKKAM